MPERTPDSRESAVDDANLDSPLGREDRQWLVVMGNHREVVEGNTYEHAVARFESSLIAQGIERKGAVFMRGHTCTRCGGWMDATTYADVCQGCLWDEAGAR